ncbi:hypothetical protein BJX64DRAFT_256155 [Aspergillus heterothallicus]
MSPDSRWARDVPILARHALERAARAWAGEEWLCCYLLRSSSIACSPLGAFLLHSLALISPLIAKSPRIMMLLTGEKGEDAYVEPRSQSLECQSMNIKDNSIFARNK